MIKKGSVLLIFIFLILQGAFGQTLKCKIHGTLINQSKQNYAYLYFPDTKLKIVSPIIHNQFVFEVDKPKNLTIAVIFLSSDSVKTYNNVIEDKKRGIHNTRTIAIENLDLIIKDNLTDAIVNGNTLNKELDEMNLAIKSNEFDNFFKQHSNSHISLKLIDALNSLNKKEMPFGASTNFKVKYFFELLSEQLRGTEEGKALLNKLEN